MMVYAPIFDNGRKCAEIDADLLQCLNYEPPFRSVCCYKPFIGFFGTIYNYDHIYKSRDAVARYWNGDPIAEAEHYYAKPRYTQAEVRKARIESLNRK